MPNVEYLDRNAELDGSGRYRFALSRTWDRARPRVLFVMLNPSTADGRDDDPTIRKCVRFARRWGYGRIDVVNLFAIRSSDPGKIAQVDDPVGPGNDERIASLAAASDLVVAAWGDAGALLGRSADVLRILTRHRDVRALAVTRAGEPRHPRFVAEDTEPQVRWPKAA